jgi:hypothetical protein
MPCIYHPGRSTVTTLFGKGFCQQCKDGIAAAVTQVPSHVEPKDCFVVYGGSDMWGPITGTGCAHWVSHQLGVSQGTDSDKCLADRTIRVATLIAGRTTIARADVQVNDIYVSPPEDHCGLVSAVTTGGAAITIRHDSSAQGGVRENDFDSYFHGTGTFRR